MASKPKEVRCADCGAMFYVPYGTWYDRVSKGKPIRCKKCRSKYIAHSNTNRTARMSADERKAVVDKRLATMANKSDDEKRLISKRISDGIKNSRAAESEESKRSRAEKWLATMAGKSDAEKRAIADKRLKTISSKRDQRKNKRSGENGTKRHVKTKEEELLIRKHRSDAAKLAWSLKSEKEKREHGEKTRAYWESLSDEEKQARNDKHKRTLANKSEEEKEARMAKFKSTWAAKSADEIERINHDRSRTLKARINAMSEAEHELHVKHLMDGNAAWRATATAEQLQQRDEKLSLAQKKIWASMTDAERNAHKSKISNGLFRHWQTVSDEERKHHGEKSSEALIKYWASLTEDERKPRGQKVSHALMSRSLDDKLATAEKLAGHDRTKTPGHVSRWFQTMFEQCYGTKYQLVRENPFVQSNVHRWDYTVIENGVPLLLVDIDECGVHGGGSTEYDRASWHIGIGSEIRDAWRGLSLSSDIPYIIISEEYKEDSFRDLVKILGMNNEECIQLMYRALRSQPFPYPFYSSKQLLVSYNRLHYRLKDGRKTPGIMALDGTNWDCLYGQHIMYHFYHSIWHDAVPGKMCPHDAYMNDAILMDMVRTHKILHVRNRNKITQCFLLSEEAPRVPIFTPIMGMKVIHKYASGYDTIVDCNTCYGGVLLASMAMDKKYIGYDQDLAHHNESNKLIEWFPTVGITVNAQMLDRVPSGPCMCSYIPYGDDYIDKVFQRTNCSKYVLIVPETDKYQDSIVETYTTDDYWGTNEWHILVINK